MKVKILKVVLAGMLLALTATAVQSAPVTYYFSGTLQDSFGTLPVGAPFCGSFTYDDAQPRLSESNMNRGVYAYTNVTVTFGIVTVTDNGPGVSISSTPLFQPSTFVLYPSNISGSLGGLTLAPSAGLYLTLTPLSSVTLFNGSILPKGLSGGDFILYPSYHRTFLQLKSPTKPLPSLGELTALSNTPVPACPPCIKAPSGMVAWYPFDEPSGALSAAEFVYWNNGARINGPTSIPAVVSNGLNFNGEITYVESPNQAWLNHGTGDFSIDAWIKTGTSTLAIIADKRVGTTPTLKGYAFYLYSGKLGLHLADGLAAPGYTNYTSPILTPPFTNGNWHHVAVTVKRTGSTGITWYYDGVAVGNSNPTNRPGTLTNGGPLRIGTSATEPSLGNWFKGGIDELEIFNRALSSAEVLSIFKAGVSGKCKCK